MAGIRPALALAAVLAFPAPAAAAPATARLSVPRAVDADCSARSHSGAGTAVHHLRARTGGYLTARLDAARGDWDLAVFRRSTGRLAAASAYRGSHEVASGFVRRGERLTVRACRRSGHASVARVRVAIEPSDLRKRARVVRVAASTPAQRRRLVRLDLDLVELVSGGFATLVLHGRDDDRRLRSAGFTPRRPPAPARAAVRARAAALPSGRSGTYRLLADYGNEMKALAQTNPDLVRPITLPLRSHEGRPVEGLEITTNPNALDGKPVYLQLGMHHAREWPAAEHPLEWAYELINAYRAGDARTRSLVDRVRTIIVPVVNPDGFNFSREAGELAGHGGGDSGFNSASAEYHRKNCAPSGCVVNGGVDPNRNYGDRWGGTGSSSVPTSETYRGTAPFSEPETENVRRLISTRQVVMMITNHTFGNEILRQPGHSGDGPTPDEPLYKAVGDEMAAENGYHNVFSYELYDHGGTTDGWSYFTTGGLGYVFEIAPSAFHAAYSQTIAHFDGTGMPGGGNREAFYVAMESAANPAHHAVLTGGAPPGALLRLTKSFTNRVDLGEPTSERFDTSMEVPASGRFEWHVNQSARPLVPGENWTLTCERPAGNVRLTQPVSVTRGQALELDLSGCGDRFEPPVDTRAGVSIALRIVGRVRGRVYRARVIGSLRGVADLERCDGAVAISLFARSKALGKRSAGLDERCRFERSFKFRRGALPRALRRPGARVRLRAVADWAGNEFLAPAQRSVSRRVVRRRR
jgi:hypothetical protein